MKVEPLLDKSKVHSLCTLYHLMLDKGTPSILFAVMMSNLSHFIAGCSCICDKGFLWDCTYCIDCSCIYYNYCTYFKQKVLFVFGALLLTNLQILYLSSRCSFSFHNFFSSSVCFTQNVAKHDEALSFLFVAMKIIVEGVEADHIMILVAPFSSVHLICSGEFQVDSHVKFGFIMWGICCAVIVPCSWWHRYFFLCCCICVNFIWNLLYWLFI